VTYPPRLDYTRLLDEIQEFFELFVRNGDWPYIISLIKGDIEGKTHNKKRT
jgi:hypothetical protein